MDLPPSTSPSHSRIHIAPYDVQSAARPKYKTVTIADGVSSSWSTRRLIISDVLSLPVTPLFSPRRDRASSKLFGSMSTVQSKTAPGTRFFQPFYVFTAAILFRAVLLVYGHYQDQNSALKYTDIDYYVFTDAAKYVAKGESPYERDTYRYTPLLAWLLIPTVWNGLWFDFGKVLFAGSDVLAGWLIYAMLRQTYQMPTLPALKYASIWLLNPMVAQISTRGSSEGVLAFMVMALLYACLSKKWDVAGIWLGVSVHFKIYPFIYAAAIIWWLDDKQLNLPQKTLSSSTMIDQVRTSFNVPRVKVALWSLLTFTILNVWMFMM